MLAAWSFKMLQHLRLEEFEGSKKFRSVWIVGNA
jgi:hypothetical protein